MYDVRTGEILNLIHRCIELINTKIGINPALREIAVKQDNTTTAVAVHFCNHTRQRLVVKNEHAALPRDSRIEIGRFWLCNDPAIVKDDLHARRKGKVRLRMDKPYRASLASHTNSGVGEPHVEGGTSGDNFRGARRHVKRIFRANGHFAL